MADDQIRLFSQFGVSNMSEEQMLQQKEQERVAAALQAAAQGPQYYRGEKDLRQAGAYLGAFLRNKFDKPELTPEQKMNAAMKEYATGAVKDRLAEDEAWRAQVEESPQLAQIEVLRQMSKYLFDAGDITRSAEMSAEAGRQFMAYRKQKAELEKFQEETTASRERREREGQEHVREISEETQVILPNSDGRFDIANLEDQTVTVRWDPERKALFTTEGNEVGNFMSLEQAIDLRELAQKEMDDSGVTDVNSLGWDKRVRLFNSAIPASERTGLRMQFDAMDTQAAIMNQTADLFFEMIDKGLNPGAFLDTQGKITDFATNLGSTIKNLGNTFMVGIATGDPEDVYNGKGEIVTTGLKGHKFEAMYEEELAAIELPEWVEAGDAAAEYRSAIVQLAYAVARSNEPGARQLSDTDFRNALRELGAAAASPERLSRVIMANFARKAKTVDRAVQRVGEIAKTVGLDAQWGRDNVYGSKVREESIVGFQDTLDRYDTLMDDINVAEEAAAISQATKIPGDDKPLAPTITGSGTPEDPIIIQ